MFSLLVKSGGWDERIDWLTPDRVFEYTADELIERFKPGGKLAVDQLLTLPAFFIPEVGGDDGQEGRVAEITGFRTSQRRIGIEYSFSPSYRSVPLAEVERLAGRLDIESFELRRTHWAIKDVDLLRELSLQREVDELATEFAPSTHDEWLREAVELVRSTRTADVQLRAIAVVRGVIEPWIDFGGERAYFARQMLLGLEVIEASIESDASTTRATVVASLLANVQVAVNWANENQYLRLAGQLMLIHEIVGALT